MTTKTHKLPGDSGTADTVWFDRQNDFEQAVIRQQVGYKRSRWPDLPDGEFSKNKELTYPHILPAGNERLAFFPGFADEVLAYMDENDIAVHTECLNLKSSQAACLNFLFPLRRDPTFAMKVLRNLLPSIASVSGIEFEYTGQDETDRSRQPCTKWLGEPKSGKRGQNRTSIDAAVFWTDAEGASHISLIEWKYTERNFGTCNAYEKATPQAKANCRSLNAVSDPASTCDLAGPGRNRGRRYWEHMASAGISLEVLGKVEGCPFQGPLYQLMRQFLVAEFLRGQKAADHVEVITLEFEGNEALRAVPSPLQDLLQSGEGTVIDAWNAALDDVPKMRRVTAEELLAGYDAAEGLDPVWRKYIRDRYGM